MTRHLFAATALAFSLVLPAKAATIEGVTFPPTTQVADRLLILNGCGMREFLWYNIYAIALYTPTQIRAAAPLFSEGVPKNVQMVITYDGKIPDELPDHWAEGLRDRLPPDMVQQIRDFYASLTRDDVASISYVPGYGSWVAINGQTVIQDPGGRLANALLSLWVGPETVSANLGRLLISGQC